MSGLRARALHVRLGGHPVLRGVDLELAPGGLVGVTGPNAAGKSTLLRALCGLVPPTSGRVELDGVPLSRRERRALARRMAYLAQDPEGAPAFCVEHVVRMGRYPQLGRFGAAGPEDLRAVETALARLDVAHLRGQRYAALSGGERQRVRLARVLATRAPVLLLDEPLAALDVRHALDLLARLRGWAAGGRLVVVALHDLDLAFRHCDRLVVLERGRVAAEGPTPAVLEPALLRRVFEVEATTLGHGERRALLLERRRPRPAEACRSAGHRERP